MAYNGTKLPFLPGFVAQTNKAYATSKRRFHGVKTSLLADFIPNDCGSNVSLTPPKSIFGKFQPTVQNLAMAVGIHLSVGTLLFYFALDDIQGEKRDNEMVDALYFTVTTMTTVGNGDLGPNTAYVKLLCSVFVLTGMSIMGLIVSKAADYIVEKQEILLLKALRNRQKYGPSETMKDMGSNEISYRCRAVMGILGAFMFLGFIYLFVGEELRFFDAIFCVITTITTVGYGRKAFTTTGGRLFAVIFIMVTIFGFGQIFMYLIEFFTESRQEALANRIVTWRMTNLHLNAFGSDNDEIAEFAVRKLKEMGKISQDDISCLMKEFEDLDVYQRGFLLASDLVHAQSPTKR